MIRATLSITLAVVLGGCAFWPTEFQGISADDVMQRSLAACQKGRFHECRGDPPTLKYCDIATRNAGQTQYRPSNLASVEQIWSMCLFNLASLESKIARIEKRKQQKQAERERIRQQAAKREQEQKERGYDFIELYSVAYTQGVRVANQLIKQYEGKVYISPHLTITSCNSDICLLEFPRPSFGPRGSSEFRMMSKGIWAEPGTPINRYRLLRFEAYGQGFYLKPIAIFRRM